MYPRYLYAITKTRMRRKQSSGLFDPKSWLPVETIWTSPNDKGGNIVVMKKVEIDACGFQNAVSDSMDGVKDQVSTSIYFAKTGSDTDG